VTTRDRLTLAAAAATVLAASALGPLYADYGWVLHVLGGVAAVATAAALARAVGCPRLLQPVAAVAGLAAFAALAFAGGTLRWGVVPGVETVRLLSSTVRQGFLDVQELGPPVPSRPGLVLLAVLGVGGIAVLVDVLAVVVRRAAVAGLPLLLLFAVPATVLSEGLGLLPFVFAAVGWLGLLVADGSDRVARWGTPLQTASLRGRSQGSTVGRTGRRISAAALGVAVVVPLLVPGLDGRLLAGSGGGEGEGGSRNTTTYNPLTRLAGQLRLPEPQTLLTYRTETAPEYLRLTTLDTFDERGQWSSSELSGDVTDDAVQRGIPIPVGQTRTDTRSATTQISVTSRLEGPWLPVPFPPTDIDIVGPWIWDTEAETVFSTRTTVGRLGTAYTVQATPLMPSAESLRGASSPPSQILKTYGDPPQVTDYVRDVVARTTAGLTTDYDRVVALQQLFRDGANGFRYDVNATAPGTFSPDALENFLRGRVGFCEQYASAMAAMTRSLSIPSRVAVGFLPGQRQEDGSYEVTTSEAHAWPEVWLGGAGWVRFEPTPRADQVDVPGYSTPQAPEEQDAASAGASAAPSAPAAAPEADLGAEDRAGEDGAANAAGTGPTTGRGSPVVLLLVAALALCLLPGLIALVRRRVRVRTADALSAWEIVRDDAIDVGHRWRAADSPGAGARRLAASLRLPAPAVLSLERLAGAAERARFARPPSPGPVDLGPGHGRVADAGPRGAGGTVPADAERLRDLAAVRSALLDTCDGWGRRRARLLPASLVMAAGTSAALLAERVQDGGDAVRQAGVGLVRGGWARARPGRQAG
jgi:transglutaminase-like putative cysteine protease/uncharacterized membrane protein YhaH (DUF805 family)